MVDSVNPLGTGPLSAAAKRARNAYHFGDAGPAAADTVALSGDVMRLRGVEGIRLDKVMTVRRQMAAGTYMTSEKIDVALDRALDRLLG